MPPQRTQPAARAVKTERTHEENQERAYIAASRRSDRSIEARVESARRASEIHKKRTGRALKVTEQDVINEDMYEEEDDDLPRHMRTFTAHLQTGSADFNTRLANYVIAHFGSLEAASDAIKKAETERREAEVQGLPVNHLSLASLFPAHLVANQTMGLEQQMAIQQQQLFGHPMPQQYVNNQTMAPNMMNMNNNSQQQMRGFSQNPYGMQNNQQQQMQMQQQINQQFSPRPQQFTNGGNGQMQQVQSQQLHNGNGNGNGNGNRNIQTQLRIQSRSNHSNSPFPPALSPNGMLTSGQTPNQNNSASVSPPALDVDGTSTLKQGNTAVATMNRNGASRQSLSISNAANNNKTNEYLQQDVSADLGMPDFQYGVGTDLYATATPQGQGNSGFFEAHHIMSGFGGGDPLQAMFQMGSTENPFADESHNAYNSNGNFKQEENGESTPAPKHGDLGNGVGNGYLQGMDDERPLVPVEEADTNWSEWTAGGDYQQVEEVED